MDCEARLLMQPALSPSWCKIGGTWLVKAFREYFTALGFGLKRSLEGVDDP
jgi:hypothetical protein